MNRVSIPSAYRQHSLYRLKARHGLGKRYRQEVYEACLRIIRKKGEGKRKRLLRVQQDGRVLYRIKYGAQHYYPVYSPRWDEIVTFLKPEWIDGEAL